MSVIQQPAVNARLAVEPRASYQNIGLVLGPAIFVIMLLFNDHQSTMSEDAWRVAAIGLWMAIWWATESVPVPVTALLPLATFEFFGIESFREAAAPYANPVIFLFMGAFILAICVERWNLHRRIALNVLLHTGTDGKRLVGGFMIVAALLSMWMTNTSVAMMLFPIATSVTAVLTEHGRDISEKQKSNLRKALLLGLAYAATIGGLATLVGTPPNALLAAFLADNYQLEISFALWMVVGVPIAAVLLPLGWFALTHWAFDVNIKADKAAEQHFEKLRTELGPISQAEYRTGAIFLVVVLMWMLRTPLEKQFGIVGFSDAGIAIMAAVLLFLTPSSDHKQHQLMVWSDVNKLPWGVLILFGGGLSLASAVSKSGLALWMGESLAPLNGIGIAFLVVAATCLVIFLTELTSNLATTATFLPVVAAVAIQADVHPLVLCIPVTLAASCAFMLPVATPPNAIVFASGHLKIPDMVRAGFIMNIIGMIIVSMTALWFAPIVFGVSF